MALFTRPKLRAIEVKPVTYEGRPYFHLHDLLSLAGSDLLVPAALGPVLALLDGEHDLSLIRTKSLLLWRLPLEPSDLVELITRLDGALLLEGESAERAKVDALAAYHAAPARPAALAGAVYPADARELDSQLLAYAMQATAKPLPAESVSGILSPHIDYARGGSVYAQGWRQAGAAARQADLVLLLGTDHAGGGGRLTLTRQDYATPWGTLETDAELRDALVDALGAKEAYAEELHHRNEHSIELAAVWLHHTRNGHPVRLLPVLCGPPAPFLSGGMPRENEGLARALAILRGVVSAGALVVVAGDLAHVGPAFGDQKAFGAVERAEVRAADAALIEACSGGHERVLAASARIDDKFRVCGLSPLVMALAIMPPVRLEIAEYAQCPADDAGASLVSVAGGCFVRLEAAGEADLRAPRG